MAQTNRTCSLTLGIIFASALCAPADVAGSYRTKLDNSALHALAKRAPSGHLDVLRSVDPATLMSSLEQLADESSDIVLVHLLSGRSTLSPSGAAPMMAYEGLVIRNWRGTMVPNSKMWFSAPFGVVSFEDGSVASTLVAGFHPLTDGGRFLLFLRYSNGVEKELTPAARLAGGEGFQGAFEIANDQVHPCFVTDALFAASHERPFDQFVAELNRLTHYQAPSEPPAWEPPSSWAEPPDLPGRELSLPMLKAAGVRIPSYWKNLRDLDLYQSSMPFHQEFAIEWNSLPGKNGQIPAREAEGLPLSSNFTLLRRTEHRPLGAGLGDFTPMNLITLGVNRDNELRAVQNQRDGRHLYLEALGGPHQHAEEFIIPKVQISINLVQDPEITQLLFFQFKWNAHGTGGHLEQVGKLDLAPAKHL